MKRLILLALGIVVVTVAGIILVHDRSLPPAAPALAAVPPKSLRAANPSPPPAMTVTRPQPALIAPPVAKRTTVDAKTLDVAFDNFSRWAAQFTNGTVTLMEGQRLAWQRREAMADLIQNDPRQAIAMAVPFELRQRLPAAITKWLETQVDGRGDFMVAVGTDFDQGSSTVIRRVQLGGKSYQAFPYGRRLGQSSQTGIPLHGIALDGRMAVSSEPLRQVSLAEAVTLDKTIVPPDAICSVSSRPVASRGQPVYAEGGGGILCFCGTDHYDLVNQQWALAESGGTGGVGSSGVAGNGAPVNDDWTHGAKNLLYIRVNFPDDLTEPISAADAYSVMNSVNSFYTTVSYNLTSLDPTVTPVITLPQKKVYYSPDPGLLLDDARAAAKQAGYDTANYDRDIVAFTTVPGYTFGGLAFVGGKGVWLQSMGAGVTAHELGHNYGLWHANFWDTTTNSSMIGPGTNLEYGNVYDTMGSAGAGIYQFNAAHKNKLDWLKADAVQVVVTNGVYRIYPFDVPASRRVDGRVYAAAVAKDFSRYYWLEFRSLFTANPWAENGLFVNWSPWPESNGGTQLIDTTPGSPTVGGDSRVDAAVVVGRTFNDNAAGVHVTTLARGATGSDPWLDVQVNTGTFPGNQPPSVTLEADFTNAPTGTLVHFHATAADPDGDALAYAWTFDDLSFSTNNLPWTSKVFTNAGDHVVRCVVSDMKGGEASANLVITAGNTSGYRITGSVTDANGVPLAGVLVSNGSNTLADFFGGWTDSDGRYVIVGAGDKLTLNAVQFGYNFTGTTNWSNPLNVASNLTEINFNGFPLPTVNVSVDTNVVAESDGTAHYITVTWTGDTNNDFTVPFFISGTATPGKDYTLAPAVVDSLITIPAGTNSVTFTFKTLNDNLNLGAETATFTLLDDLNYGSPGYALAPSAAATITILDDDAPAQPTITVATTTPQISDDGIDRGQFIFTRFGSIQNDLLVNYATGGSAQAGTDYTPLAGVVLIPAGQSQATVSLQPLNDHLVDSNKTVTVTLLGNPAYTPGTPSSASVIILDDGAPTVTVFPTTSPAAEPSTAGVFTIKRDGDLSGALVVGYTTGGTAVPAVDYVPLSGVVTIPAGSTSVDVILIPLEDGLLAPDKTVTLILTNDFNYDVGTPGSASISITESERPTVFIGAPLGTASEQGDTFGQFKVSRTATSGDLLVYLALSGTATPGADYLPLDNPVLIPDGSSSVALDVIPFHDVILEPAESVILTVQANTNYNVGSPATASVKLTDDATSPYPGVGFCFATSAYPEGQSPGIAVALSYTSSVPVTVSYKVIGGTAPAGRFSLPQGTLTITTNSQVAFIPLVIVDDNLVQPPQTVKVVLFNPTNATLDGIKVHTYTILDDDSAVVSVTATAPNALETGAVPGNFRITRAGPTNASQLVNFQLTGSASAPTDYAPLGTSVTIPAGAAFVDLPVIPTDDHSQELSQTVVLTLISATNGTINFPNVATVTISDNDTNPLPVVSVTSTNRPYAIEGGTNGAFLFTRTGATNNALVISFIISGTAPGSRYAPLTNSITIAAGQVSASLPVMAIDDSLVEGEQTVIVSLTVAETYRSAFPSSATVIIQDNDQTVWLDASDFQASKYGPDPGQFTFTRFGTTNTPAIIFYTISGTAGNGSDYSLITNRIVIPAGQLTATLPILPQHTGIPRGPLTATLTLLTNAAYFTGMPSNGTVTIADDMPMVTLTGIITDILEGGATNGVFRLTRTGDPQFDFTAYVAVGGTAQYNVDYAAFVTNVYFSCGVTAIDLLVSSFNDGLSDGSKTVTADLIPNPAYTILAPSNAVITIEDAGTDITPLVQITKPVEKVIFLTQTNRGLKLQATVTSNGSNTLTWTEPTGLGSLRFDTTNTADTAVLFTNAGVYRLRLTADDGLLQGYAEITVVVGPDQLVPVSSLAWPFDEGSGTNVQDFSGLGHDGVLVGHPAWTTNAVLGDALRFPGTNDYVRQSAGGNVLNGRNQFSLSLWVRSETTNLDQGIFTASLGAGATLSLATRSHASCGNFSNVIEATLATTKGVVHRMSASNVALTNQWQNLVLTWSNNLALDLYVNGLLDQPATQWKALAGTITNCPDFIVGEGSADSPSSWKGLIDEVKLFPQRLTPDQILSLSGIRPGDTNGNQSPLVDAGSNQTVQITIPLLLAGTASDDGLPKPPGLLTTTWELLYTNNVDLPDTNSLTNTVVFADPGDYTFRLTANDGDVSTFAEVTISAILPTRIDVTADTGDAYELGPVPGSFTVTRDLTQGPLTVYLALSGTASNSLDYVSMTNVVTFPDGSNSVSLPVQPFLDYAIEGDESVIYTVLTNAAYYIGNAQATVTIHDSPYGLWSIQHFTIEQLTHPLISGPSADFDNDGTPNFMEYAFNHDPTAPDAPPYAWDFETNTNDNRQHLTLTYTRRLPPRDVQYGVFVSTDLVHWNTGTNYVEEFLNTNDVNGITETVKTRARAFFPGTNNLFMNIRVWLEQVPAP